MSLTSFELYFRFMYCIRHLVSSLIFHAVSGNSSRSPWGPLRRFALCCVFFHYQASLISLLCRRESLVLHFLLWWWFSHQVVSDWDSHGLQPLGSSAALSHLGFPKQEYWSRLPFPAPEYLSNPGIELGSPALQAGFFFLTTWANREAYDLPQVVAMGETTCHKANL